MYVNVWTACDVHLLIVDCMRSIEEPQIWSCVSLVAKPYRNFVSNGAFFCDSFSDVLSDRQAFGAHLPLMRQI